MLSFSQFSLPSVIRIVYDVVSRVTILLKNGLSFRSRGSTSLETFDPRLIPNFSHLFISQKSLPVAKLSFEIRLTPRISFDSQDSRFHTWIFQTTERLLSIESLPRNLIFRLKSMRKKKTTYNVKLTEQMIVNYSKIGNGETKEEGESWLDKSRYLGDSRIE